MSAALQWLNSVTDEVLKSRHDAATYSKGVDYAERGRVRHLVLSEDGTRLRALVKGSANYRTTIAIDTSGSEPTWTATCTCPVGKSCKHSVALLISARSQRVRPAAGAGNAAPPAPAPDILGDWRSVFGKVLSGADAPGEKQPPLTMGLQFQRASAQQLTGEFRIRLRPVCHSEDGRWVPQGVSWVDLTRNGYSPPVRSAQMLAFRGLWDAHQLGSSMVSGRQSGEAVHLEDLGPSTWRLLRAAQEAGIALLGHREGPEEVVLADSFGDIALDVTTRDGDADLHVRAVLTVDDELMRGSFLKLLGDPVHGVAVMDPSKQQVAPQLTLVQLREPVTGPLMQLLATNRRLTVAEHETGEFLGQYGPALRECMPVLSSTDTVVVPVVGDPVVGLTVAFSPTRHVATLSWSLRYPVGDHDVDLPLVPRQTHQMAPGFPRDLEAEVALREVAMQLRLPRSARVKASEDEDGPEATFIGMPLNESTLSSADTALFAHEHLPELEKHPKVKVTVTGAPPDFRVAASSPQVSIEALTEDSVGDWFDLGIAISVDGEDVPLRDVIAAMAQGDDAVVLESGVWFSLDHPHLESLRAMVAESQDLVDESASSVRLNMFRPDLWAELVRDARVVGTQRRWLEQMRGLANLSSVPHPDPAPGLDATLRPYQDEGYRWLSFLWDHGLGGILADDMGLGKTMQSLAAICRQHGQGWLHYPVLIVAPTSVVAAWLNETDKFAPHLTAVGVTQTAGKRGTSLAELIDGADVVVTSYTLLRLDADDYHSMKWGAVIYDEAQFVKNHTSATYKTARQLTAGFRLAVTGTPLENSLMDLWSLLSLTAPGLFPDPARFTTQFRRPIESGKAPERLTALRQRIRPFMLRRSKSQVATDLPPKIEQVLGVDLTEEHRAIYERHLQRERQRVMGLLDDMPKNRMAIFKSLTMLRQLALDPSLVDDEYAPVTDGSKLGNFIDHMQELIAEGHRALVFSQFTGYLGLVRKQLEKVGIPYAYLDGSTTDRQTAIKDFTETDRPVFLISLKAGGFGLTLTQADYVFVLDPWWNPAAEAQAIDRAHRIGQDKSVMVYRMMATGTIEEKVLALQERKRALFDQVIDDAAMLSTVLSAEDVRGLFAPV